MEENNPTQPSVLIFPLPVQGHVTSMLNLAELLFLSGVHVTFLITDHAHRRLLRHGAPLDRPGFVFRTIPDGLPEDHPRSSDKVSELVRSLKATVVEQGSLKQVLDSEAVNCIVADGVFGNFMVDVGVEVQIPVILFRTASASYFWVCFSVPDIVQAGQLPVTGGEDKDRVITSVAGMENFLRCRDLPNFGPLCNFEESILQRIGEVTRHSSRAAGVIFNTFEDLEGPFLSHIRASCNSKTYAIGPLHAHLKERLEKRGSSQCRDRPSSSSLFEVDTMCLPWLDLQPLNSVVYVSFGSLAFITPDQLMEFWHGLVNSKKRFLWVIRKDLLVDVESNDDGSGVSHELSEGTKERGFIAKWVPQEKVLSHPAVGGFLTHSGWNSTLESIVAGVPMICWSCFADQQTNSRFVGEVWKLGIDMKDVCDRKVVEKIINDLMVERRDEFASSSSEMAELAKKSVSRGGSSYRSLDNLIEDIKTMRK